MKTQPCLNLSVEQSKTRGTISRACALFQHFQNYKSLAVHYFSISNRLKPQPHLILAFSVEENLASSYFTFLNNITTQPTLAVPYFSISDNARLLPYII